jgi:hypothetical protein
MKSNLPWVVVNPSYCDGVMIAGLEAKAGAMTTLSAASKQTKAVHTYSEVACQLNENPLGAFKVELLRNLAPVELPVLGIRSTFDRLPLAISRFFHYLLVSIQLC